MDNIKEIMTDNIFIENVLTPAALNKYNENKSNNVKVYDDLLNLISKEFENYSLNKKTKKYLLSEILPWFCNGYLYELYQKKPLIIKHFITSIIKQKVKKKEYIHMGDGDFRF